MTQISGHRVGAWLVRARAAASGRHIGLVVLALLVGVGAGAGAIAFRELVVGLTRLFTGQDEYGLDGRAGNPSLGVGPWFLLVAPVVGGLVYGPLVARLAPETRGHGVPEVMLAVARGGGIIRPRVAVVKALASALCIGSGGSVGREGPIVQIGSALGSALGQLARADARRMRLLVACGAAGGISATFNAPIAGVFFALELILGDFAAGAFGAVVLSSVTANVIARAYFGNAPFLSLPPFEVSSVWQYLMFAGLGVAAAGVALAFIAILYGLEDVADRLWRGPEWLRPAVGGLLLGGILLALPELYGVGYGVLEGAVRGHYAVAFIIVLLAGKALACSMTIAIGGSGGVFAPSLFMGAMVGEAYGVTAHDLLPGQAGGAGAYAIVGMAAVFAAASRAPITAVIVIFELTGDYAIILPLMLAVVIATGLSRLASADTIYTKKLRRRGIDLGSPPTGVPGLSVRDAMAPAPRPLAERLPADAVLAELAAGGDAFPVIDAAGRYVGVIDATAVERALESGTTDARSARDLARAVPVVGADDDLAQAARLLSESDGAAVPVLDGQRVVGWIAHRDVVRAYGRALAPQAAGPVRAARARTQPRPVDAEPSEAHDAEAT